MPTSVLFTAVYVAKEHKWSVAEKDMVEGPLTKIEISIWSLFSFISLISIACVFAFYRHISVESAVVLTSIYLLMCILISNEFLLSDWHTE
jgi:uncharacterized membrane protein YoaK (UPF0700 family)